MPLSSPDTSTGASDSFKLMFNVGDFLSGRHFTWQSSNLWTPFVALHLHLFFIWTVMSTVCYYELLNLTKDATHEEIRRQYKSLSLVESS